MKTRLETLVCVWSETVGDMTGLRTETRKEGRGARMCKVIEPQSKIADIPLAPSLRIGHLGPKSWGALVETGIT